MSRGHWDRSPRPRQDPDCSSQWRFRAARTQWLGWGGGVSKEETQEFLREGHSLWRGLTTCTSGSSRDQEGVHGRPPLKGVLLRISLWWDILSVSHRTWLFPSKDADESVVHFTLWCHPYKAAPLTVRGHSAVAGLPSSYRAWVPCEAHWALPAGQQGPGAQWDLSFPHGEDLPYPLRPDLRSRAFLPSFLNWSDLSLGLSANWFSVLTQCLPVHLSGGVWLYLSRINSLLHPFLSLFLITFYIHSSVYLNVHLQKLSLFSPASMLILIQSDVKYMKKIFYSTLFTVGWKVSKLSSFYFPLKFHLQNNFSVEKRTLLQVITLMPLNYFPRFNDAPWNLRARPSPSHMFKVHCLGKQFRNQPQRCHYAVIIWLVILSFTYLMECEDVAETKRKTFYCSFSKFTPGYSFAIPA